MSSGELAAMATVVAALGLLLPAVRWLTLRGGTSAEVARKSVHMAMGMACMTFPWLFENPLSVWLLAALVTAPLLLLRLAPGWRNGVGAALHGVKRLSYGEMLFAPAVALVFDLAGGNAFLFCIPVAILTLADAAGALGGTRWGRHRYGCGGGFKSLEGSAVFFLTALACVMLPLWLGGREDVWGALWIGLILGLLAMMMEGMADRGFDNLLIPVGSFFVLDRLLRLDDASLIWRCAVAAMLLAVVWRGARNSTMNGGALLGCALLGYGCAVLADARFVLPPLAVFGCHLFVTRKHRLVGMFDHRLDAVLCHAIACMPWVLAIERDAISADAGLAGVSFAMATQLAVMTMVTHRCVHQRPASLPHAMIKGWALGGLPGLLWLIDDAAELAIPALLAFASCLVVVVVYRETKFQQSGNITLRWVLQGCAALLCSLPAIILER